jgi:hypothetical protein
LANKARNEHDDAQALSPIVRIRRRRQAGCRRPPLWTDTSAEESGAARGIEQSKGRILTAGAGLTPVSASKRNSPCNRRLDVAQQPIAIAGWFTRFQNTEAQHQQLKSRSHDICLGLRRPRARKSSSAYEPSSSPKESLLAGKRSNQERLLWPPSATEFLLETRIGQPKRRNKIVLVVKTLQVLRGNLNQISTRDVGAASMFPRALP